MKQRKTEHPILMCGEMVRAILAGTKTETRRMAGLKELNKKHDYYFVWKDDFGNYHEVVNPNKTIQLKHPYGVAGETLWVRETWTAAYGCGSYENPTEGWGYFKWDEELYGKMTADGIVKETAHSGMCLFYRADGEDALPAEFSMPHGNEIGWRPSIHMPRWASRITLTVKSVTLERLHEITDEGAKAEGVSDRAEYEKLWNTINGPESWDSNPWLWVVKFEVANIRR